MVKTSKSKKVKDRGYASFFPKLAKKLGAAAKGDVHRELDKMFTFVLKSVTDAGQVILNEYATKEDTVKPKVLQAALAVLLHGELKTNAIQAGVAAEVARVEKVKSKASKKAGEKENTGKDEEGEKDE